MSYDISYRVQCKDDPKLWADIGNCEANITWNLREMIRKSTGLEWKNEEDNGLVKDVIPFIIHGLEELERFPNKYKQYESPNGWGTISGCKNFFTRCILDWTNFTEDSWTSPYKDIVHFWIV